MGNMAYCRFRNTLDDLHDCYRHIDDEVSEAEAKARTELVRLCGIIASEVGDD